MYQVNIYIEIDNASPQVTEKQYAYILECQRRSGEPVTREKFGAITGTYHQATLTALNEAMERINQSCVVRIYSQDMFVLNMIDRNLSRWVATDFKNTRGNPLANWEEWRKFWMLYEKHKVSGRHGTHEYTKWLQDAMKKQKEVTA